METIKDTIDLSLKLPLLRANFFTYLPLPGTESYRGLEETGELTEVDWDNFYFMSAAYTPKGISRETLLGLKKKAFLKFHLRPIILFKNIMAIRNLNHFKFLLKRFYHWILMKDFIPPEYLVAKPKE